MTNVETVVER